MSRATARHTDTDELKCFACINSPFHLPHCCQTDRLPHNPSHPANCTQPHGTRPATLLHTSIRPESPLSAAEPGPAIVAAGTAAGGPVPGANPARSAVASAELSLRPAHRPASPRDIT